MKVCESCGRAGASVGVAVVDAAVFGVAREENGWTAEVVLILLVEREGSS